MHSREIWHTQAAVCWYAAPGPGDEAYRRSILARSRNYLLTNVLRDEEWVLWLDADITRLPPTIVEVTCHRPCMAGGGSGVALHPSPCPCNSRIIGARQCALSKRAS